MSKRKCLSCALLILNGGHSSRMGRNKGNLPWDDGTMLTALLTRSIAYPFGQTIISANEPIDLSPLRGHLYTAASPTALTPEELTRIMPTKEPQQFLWQLHSGNTRFLTIVADTYTDCGPLGGMEAGLRLIASPFVFVTSVDLPFYNFIPLRNWLYNFPWDDIDRDNLPIVLPVVHGKEEPLAALYPTAIYPAVRKALQSGDYRVRQLCTQATVWRRDESAYAALYANTNTPLAYKLAKAKRINQRRAVPTFSIMADHSNMGKTTLCIKLIEKFRAAGYAVGYVKSTHHTGLTEKEGSDTDAATKAGASIRLCGPDDIPLGMDKQEFLLTQSQEMEVNISFIESRSRGSFPAIKILSSEPTPEDIDMDSPYIAFMYTGEKFKNLEIPQFSIHHIDALYDFIISLL